MKLFNIFFLIIVLVISAGTLNAQQFVITPDSTEGVGGPDGLFTFHSTFENLWNQENLILWRSEFELPEGWALEICQTGLTCWPEWITSDTMELPPNVVDTLEVKFYTSQTEGTGTATVFLTPLANGDYHQEHTFSLRLGADGVRNSSSSSRSSNGLEFKLINSSFKTFGANISLPANSEVNIAVFDIQGRMIETIWSGMLSKGDNNLILNSNLITTPGTYFMRLDGKRLGSVTQKFIYLK